MYRWPAGPTYFHSTLCLGTLVRRQKRRLGVKIIVISMKNMHYNFVIKGVVFKITILNCSKWHTSLNVCKNNVIRYFLFPLVVFARYIELEYYLKLAIKKIGPITFSERLKEFQLISNSEYIKMYTISRLPRLTLSNKISAMVKIMVNKIEKETHVYHVRFKIFLGHDKTIKNIVHKWTSMSKFLLVPLVLLITKIRSIANVGEFRRKSLLAIRSNG